jgi:hypothetical protein
MAAFPARSTPAPVTTCARPLLFVGQRSNPTTENWHDRLLIKTALLSKLSVAIRAVAVPFDGDSFSGGKVRSVSAMAQPANVIRGSATLRAGTVIMEHFAHQQNLAHYRRQLAEAELATSSDEIRHSMLMRLLAEEEANVLVMPVSVIVGQNRRVAG